MTRKAIHYSHHAIREMRKADVRPQHVRHVLATAERWVAEITPRDTYYGKTARVGRRRDVTVIYLEDAHRVLVVTVYVVGNTTERPRRVSKGERSMLVTYDREVDALAIDLVEDARRARTERLEGGVLLHRDRNGRVIELEILAASTRYPLQDLELIGSPAEWLTLREAATESGLAPTTLKNQIHNQRLTAQKRGHDWLISRAALWSYLENREARAQPAMKGKARPRGRHSSR